LQSKEKDKIIFNLKPYTKKNLYIKLRKK